MAVLYLRRDTASGHLRTRVSKYSGGIRVVELMQVQLHRCRWPRHSRRNRDRRVVRLGSTYFVRVRTLTKTVNQKRNTTRPDNISSRQLPFFFFLCSLALSIVKRPSEGWSESRCSMDTSITKFVVVLWCISIRCKRNACARVDLHCFEVSDSRFFDINLQSRDRKSIAFTDRG